MTRAVVYVVLVALAFAAFASGAWALALAAGAAKAGLVGYEFMELRSAHPLHRAGFLLGIAAVALVLRLVT